MAKTRIYHFTPWLCCRLSHLHTQFQPSFFFCSLTCHLSFSTRPPHTVPCLTCVPWEILMSGWSSTTSISSRLHNTESWYSQSWRRTLGTAEKEPSSWRVQEREGRGMKSKNIAQKFMSSWCSLVRWQLGRETNSKNFRYHEDCSLEGKWAIIHSWKPTHSSLPSDFF